MQRLFPTPMDGVVPDEVYADLGWQPAGDRPFMALNMVSSVDGRATWHGSAAGIGGPVDMRLMKVLRTNADALLWGAGTIRADRVGNIPDDLVPLRTRNGLAPQPLLTVLTSSGEISLERAFKAEPERIVVFVAEATPGDAVARLRERATVVVAGAERPEPGRVVRILRRDYGVRHILCEGGPILNRSLLADGVLDELFLTLAPKFLAGDGLMPIIGPELVPPLPLTLRSIYEHEGELYLRYRVGT